MNFGSFFINKNINMKKNSYYIDKKKYKIYNTNMIKVSY